MVQTKYILFEILTAVSSCACVCMFFLPFNLIIVIL